MKLFANSRYVIGNCRESWRSNAKVTARPNAFSRRQLAAVRALYVGERIREASTQTLTFFPFCRDLYSTCCNVEIEVITKFSFVFAPFSRVLLRTSRF